MNNRLTRFGRKLDELAEIYDLPTRRAVLVAGWDSRKNHRLFMALTDASARCFGVDGIADRLGDRIRARMHRRPLVGNASYISEAALE
jgi:hypothetical protein